MLIQRFPQGSIGRGCIGATISAALVTAMFASQALAGDPSSDERVLWQFEFATQLAGGYVTALEDGTIYATDSTALYALTEDGELIWSLPGAGGGRPIPVANDGTIYTGINGIKAINPDGTLKWQYTPPDNLPLLAGPGIGPDGNIYAVQDRILSLDQGLGAFSLDPDGNLRWSNVGDPPIFNTDGGTNSEVVFGEDAMFVGLGQAAIRAFDLSDGDQLWHSGELGIAATTQPRQLPDGRLVFRMAQTGVIVLNQDGSESWSALHPQSVSILTIPAVGPDGMIYIGDWLGLNLWAVTSEGDTAMVGDNTSDTLSVLAVSPDNQTLLAGGGGSFGESGWVRRYDPADLSFQWQVDLPFENGVMQLVQSIRPEFTSDGKTVYVTSTFAGSTIGHSYLYAIDLTDGDSNVPGDIDGDGVVNVADLLTLLASWGACAGCPADLDNNGTVNVTDLLIMLANWS